MRKCRIIIYQKRIRLCLPWQRCKKKEFELKYLEINKQFGIFLITKQRIIIYFSFINYISLLINQELIYTQYKYKIIRMKVQNQRYYPEGYKDGNRLTYTPVFGDTINNVSVKFLYLQNQKKQIFRIPYMDSNRTFDDILTKYKKQINYINSSNVQLMIRLKLNMEIIDVGQRLQYYKKLIEDTSMCYFQVIEKLLIQGDSQSKIKKKQKIDKIIQEKDYKLQRLLNEDEKFFISIKKPDNSKFTIQGHRDLSIIEIKCDICHKFSLDIEQFILIYAGKKLDTNEQTLQQLQITQTGAEIMMIMKSKNGCVRATSMIQINEKQSTNITNLHKGDQIYSFNEEKDVFEIDTIQTIHRTQVDQYIRITFQNNDIVQCSPNHKFYTNGQVWNDYCYDFNQPTARLQAGDKLLTSSNTYECIKSISTIALEECQTFYHLSIKNNHTFIIDKYICHNMQVRIVNSQNGIQFLLDTNEYDTIGDIKRKISKNYNYSLTQQIILFNERQLRNSQSLKDFKDDFKNSSLRLLIRYDKQFVIHRISSMKEYKIDISRAETVLELKEIIQIQLQIQIKHQILFVSNIYLEDKMKLQKYLIRQNYNRINLFEINDEISKSNLPRFSNKKFEMKITIQDNSEFNINYDAFKHMEIKNFIASFINNSRASYSFLFGEILMHPSQKIIGIEKIEEDMDLNNYKNTHRLECKVIRNYDKLAFYKKIMDKAALVPNKIRNVLPNQEKEIKQKQNTMKIKIINQINQVKLKQYNLKIQDLYYAIQYFICEETYKDLLLFLKRFKTQQQKGIKQIDGFTHCSVLARSLLCLPTYYGIVHKVIQNFRLSQCYKPGQLFYWQAFLSTSINQGNVTPLLKKGKSTLFHIECINGRNISSLTYKNKDEVVFLPYSYFFIEQIKVHPDHDQVWLTQMSTPLSFNKNIIIWVDDVPTNNRDLVEQFQLLNMEVVQLTSTKIAELWMKQFGWYLKWNKIQCKVVSDMVRISKWSNETDFEAGINLLQNFHSSNGYTDPILIYCTDVKKAQQNVKKRNLPANRYSAITNQINDVQRFCTQNK